MAVYQVRIVEKKCATCGKGIYILNNVHREQLFCTIECLEKYNSNMNNNKLI